MPLSVPPIQQPLLNQRGAPTQEWILFFNNLKRLTGNVELTASAGSTVVQNKNVNTGSIVIIFPTSAAAALDWSSGDLYVVAEKEQFTIYHTNAAVTGRTFNYMVVQ